MAFLTADRKSIRKDGAIFAYPVASNTVIYAGALTAIDEDGNAVPAGSSQARRLVGKADMRGDNSNGASGDVIVTGHREGVYEYTTASDVTRSDIGRPVFVVDDQTVDVRRDEKSIYAGTIVYVEGSRSVFVDLLGAVRR